MNEFVFSGELVVKNRSSTLSRYLFTNLFYDLLIVTNSQMSKHMFQIIRFICIFFMYIYVHAYDNVVVTSNVFHGFFFSFLEYAFCNILLPLFLVVRIIY